MLSDLDLVGKIILLARGLTAASIPHAFGGALALAYYAEPRATQDIDVNVFVEVRTSERVSDALGSVMNVPVDFGGTDLGRDGQTRCWWGHTPLDLFFAYDPVHEAMARRCRLVQFATGMISILAPEYLVICKVAFDRPKDWIDIEAMKMAGTEVDLDECRLWLTRLLDVDDPRIERLHSLLIG